MSKVKTKAKKFPSTPELKRVLGALQASGLEIAAVEIELERICAYTTAIIPVDDPAESAFNLWKMGEGTPM